MDYLSNIKTGDEVQYQGKTAVVVSAHSYSNIITINVDGKLISVDKNDLFGMNSNLSDNGYISEQIANCDETIEKNKTLIENSKQIYADAKKSIKNIRSQMGSILKSFGVSHFSQITDEAQKAHYIALRKQKTTERSSQIRAVSDILHAAHSTASAAIDKKELLNQQALCEYLA